MAGPVSWLTTPIVIGSINDIDSRMQRRRPRLLARNTNDLLAPGHDHVFHNLATRQLHLFDLASGSDHRLDASAWYATFSWPMVIWAQATGDLRFHAASAITGKLISLPAELSSVRDVHFVVGAPGKLAWSGGPLVRDLWFWQPGSQPRILLRASDYADVWSIGSTLIGAVGSSADYLVDLRSGATTEVPNRVLGPVLNGDALAITRAMSGVTEMSVPMTVSVLSSSALPQLAGC